MEELVNIDLEVIKKTNLAVIVTDGDNTVSLPLSLIFEPDEFEIGNSYTFEIPEWLAIEKELV